MEEQVQTWYQQYRTGLYRYALSLLKEPHLAEDALQETFVRMLGQRILPAPEKVQAWLYRVIRNICYDMQRKRKWEAPEEPAGVTQWKTGLEFTDLIASLPQKEQEILALRFIGGLSHKEVAGILGMTLHSVKKRYERAIQALRGEWEVAQ